MSRERCELMPNALSLSSGEVGLSISTIGRRTTALLGAVFLAAAFFATLSFRTGCELTSQG